MNIKPLNDVIFFKKLSEEKKTESGIIIPELATKSDFIKGEVVAVGTGQVIQRGMEEIERVPMYVKVGEIIVAPKRACTKIELEGQEYYIVTQAQAILHYEKE